MQLFESQVSGKDLGISNPSNISSTSDIGSPIINEISEMVATRHGHLLAIK